MKKILFITTTPTVGGNGDTLIEAAMEVAKEKGSKVQRVDVRDKNICSCKACYKCKDSGKCVQEDDFAELLTLIHESDGIIAEAPIYYNCMAAQAITVIDRFCCTFSCPSYQLGSKKKVGILLTCTGSSSEEMKRHVNNILTLPSLQRSIEEFKTEVFTNCGSADSCLHNKEYLQHARMIGEWVTE